MATETKTETKAIVSTSAKVVGAIVALLTAAQTVISRKRAVAETVTSEAKRMGLDESQARAMVTASWLEAQGIKPDAATQDQKNAVKFDVSKVMALAYPAKPAELKAAYAFNDANADNKIKQSRIGENTLLEIARGNLTAKQAIAGKGPKRGAGKTGGKLDKVLSASERMQNSFAGVFASFKVGAKDRPTVEETKEAFDKALAAYVGEAKAATK